MGTVVTPSQHGFTDVCLVRFFERSTVSTLAKLDIKDGRVFAFNEANLRPAISSSFIKQFIELQMDGGKYVQFDVEHDWDHELYANGFLFPSSAPSQ